MPALSDALQRLAARPGVTGGLVISDEGLVVAAEAPPVLEVEAVAALAATAQRAEAQLAGALGQPVPTTTVLAGAQGSLIVERLSSGATLLVIAGETADLGEVLFAVRSEAPRLADSY